MRYFPLFVDTKDAEILFVGGTDGVLSKLRLWLKTQAKCSVVALEAEADIVDLAAQGRVALSKRAFQLQDLAQKRVIIVSTGSPVADHLVSWLAQHSGKLVNVVDDPENCTAITASLVDRDPLVIAIGTEGAAPVLARRIKADLEERLSPKLGLLVATAAKLRARVSNDLPSRTRRALWERFFSDEGLRALDSEAALEEHFLESQTAAGQKRDGRLVYIGAGPGDAELLTLKARKVLHQADLVLHHHTISAEILELARRESTRINVDALSDELRARICADVAEGALVVWLQSGDVARHAAAVAEHASWRAAQVPFEIIAGIAGGDAANNTEAAKREVA